MSLQQPFITSEDKSVELRHTLDRIPAHAELGLEETKTLRITHTGTDTLEIEGFSLSGTRALRAEQGRHMPEELYSSYDDFVVNNQSTGTVLVTNFFDGSLTIFNNNNGKVRLDDISGGKVIIRNMARGSIYLSRITGGEVIIHNRYGGVISLVGYPEGVLRILDSS
ncbi:hypothetical protein MMC12_007236 [Toensbergia leucococca]|nr:hypothetical protein [Toensbergia leucococca]